MPELNSLKNTWQVARSWEHLKNPFSYCLQFQEDAAVCSSRLSSHKRITSVALSVFVGLFTFAIGGVAFFYTYTAYLKNRKIQKLAERSYFEAECLGKPFETLTPPKSESASSGKLPPASSEIQKIFNNYIFKKKENGIQGGMLPIPPPESQLPDPPIDGVKVGIMNLGSTCWLNSALKFMAGTKQYDGLFRVDVDNLQKAEWVTSGEADVLKELQKALRLVLVSLRKGGTGTLLNADLYKRLVAAYDRFRPEDKVWTDQLDSADFFRALHSAYNFPSADELQVEGASEEIKKSYPQVLAHYRSASPGVLKYAKIENFTHQLVLTLQENEYRADDPLNIPRMYGLGEPKTVRHDFIFGDDVKLASDPDDEGQPFVEERALMNAPETLIINFERHRYSFDPSSGRMIDVKCDRRIQLDPGDTMNFTEYDVGTVSLDDNRMGTTAQAKYTCIYQVEAAICHGGSAHGGHYTAYERAKDGTIWHHNDESVIRVNQAEARKGWESATILRLKRVGKVLIDSPAEPSCKQESSACVPDGA